MKKKLLSLFQCLTRQIFFLLGHVRNFLYSLFTKLSVAPKMHRLNVALALNCFVVLSTYPIHNSVCLMTVFKIALGFKYINENTFVHSI